ncbi:MAG: hypothetical protein WD904_01215 [Dehalococcoidia bacterium]
MKDQSPRKRPQARRPGFTERRDSIFAVPSQRNDRFAALGIPQQVYTLPRDYFSPYTFRQ